MKKFLVISTIFLSSFLFFSVTFAAGLNTAGSLFKSVGGSAGADTYTEPEQLVGVIINAALTLTGLIFLILMIYAGYLWLTARGEEEPITKAKKIITSTIIGFVLVASAYSITVFIGGRLGSGTTSGGSDNSCGSGGLASWSCLNVDTCFTRYSIASPKTDIASKRITCENSPDKCQTNKCAKAGDNIICCKNQEEEKATCGAGSLADWECGDVFTCLLSDDPSYNDGNEKPKADMLADCTAESSFCKRGVCSGADRNICCKK